MEADGPRDRRGGGGEVPASSSRATGPTRRGSGRLRRGAARTSTFRGARVRRRAPRRSTRRAARSSSPPADEDYGYIALEAFLSKKPVVTCTDSGGPLEFVVDGENGRVVAPGCRGRRRRAAGAPRDAGAIARDSEEEALKAVRGITWDAVVCGSPRRGRPRVTTALSVGFVSPLPPSRSGIADYSAEILAALCNEIWTSVTYEPAEARRRARRGPRRPPLPDRERPAAPPSVEALCAPGRTTPAVVVLHDFVLHHLFAAAYLDRGREADYARELERAHGARGRALGEQGAARARASRCGTSTRGRCRCRAAVVRAAEAVIVALARSSGAPSCARARGRASSRSRTTSSRRRARRATRRAARSACRSTGRSRRRSAS